MSWKGFQKGIARTPQALRQKMHKGSGESDLVYSDAERRFYAIESQAERLQGEAKKYTDAVKKMLHHQIEYSKVIERLYAPISGVLSDPNAPTSEESNPQAIAACQQYRGLMEVLQALLKPDLDMVESQIIQPCKELVVLIESIKKIMTKRSHKQLDLDRHTASLRKVQDQNERSAKQEEKMFKVENEYEIALEQFNYYNDLLKTELPQLFYLEGQMIKPLFESFYFMQLNVFYTMHTHVEEMKIPYFDLEGDIVQKFHAKRGDVLARTEQIPIVHYTNKPERTPSKLRAFRAQPGQSSHANSRSGSPFATSDPAHPTGSPAHTDSTHGHAVSKSVPPRRFEGTLAEELDNEEPPAYSTKERTAGHAGTAASQNSRPSLPSRHKPAVEYCIAAYDYTAQSESELSLKAGDRIEVIDRSQGAEGWWEGVLHGAQGFFPGAFVKLS